MISRTGVSHAGVPDIHSRVRFAGYSATERCQQARQLASSEPRQLARAEQEALEVLKQHRTNPEGLLQTLTRWGVTVLPGVQNPEVEAYLKQGGLNAGLYEPYSLNQPTDPGNWQDSSIPPAMRERLRDSEENQRFALFFKNGVTLSTIFHETFHLFQAMNGLPLKGKSLLADLRAGRYFEILLDQCRNPRTPQKQIQDSLTTIRDQDPDAFEGLKIRLKRELEVSRFLLKNCAALDLPLDRAWETERIGYYQTLLSVSD